MLNPVEDYELTLKMEMSRNVEQSLLACLYRYKDSPFDDERNDEC